jgi:hypothetical protein
MVSLRRALPKGARIPGLPGIALRIRHSNFLVWHKMPSPQWRDSWQPSSLLSYKSRERCEDHTLCIRQARTSIVRRVSSSATSPRQRYRQDQRGVDGVTLQVSRGCGVAGFQAAPRKKRAPSLGGRGIFCRPGPSLPATPATPPVGVIAQHAP